MYNAALSLLPESFVNLLGTKYYNLIYKKKRKSEALPEVFSQIYANGEWGDLSDPAYSGLGSRGELLSKTVNFTDVIIDTKKVRSMIDIGCGDGHFSRALLERNKSLNHYTGIDVVESVIKMLDAQSSDSRASFELANATNQEFKGYDLVVIRQVLQHLSNADIQKVLNNVASNTYLLIIEHYPTTIHVKNKDIISGKMTRRFFNSCVDIEAQPFKHGWVNTGQQFEEISVSSGGVLKTNLYKRS